MLTFLGPGGIARGTSAKRGRQGEKSANGKSEREPFPFFLPHQFPLQLSHSLPFPSPLTHSPPFRRLPCRQCCTSSIILSHELYTTEYTELETRIRWNGKSSAVASLSWHSPKFPPCSDMKLTDLQNGELVHISAQWIKDDKDCL